LAGIEAQVSITAIVVNFNAGEALGNCVRALLDSTVNVGVVVADNASTDGSAENLRSLYGDYPGIEILFNPVNLGFAAAVNACARAVRTDWILIINPDCVVERDTIALLSDEAGRDERAALAGPGVLGRDGKLERASLRRFPDPWNSLMTISGLWRLGRWIPLFRGVPVDDASMPAGTVTADAVTGACMLVRRQALVEIGYMDEGYGLHCEDLDLMYRLHEAGWHCLYVPRARAVHTQGVSSRSRPMWVHRQKHLGMARFFRKFKAAEYPLPVNWLVYTGIWLHYALLAPFAWLRK
jgi:GT2 family glycosyltransferase